MNKENISIISTYATDRLIDADTIQIIQEQKGGPVLYIVRALETLGLEPKVYTAEEMLVEILVRKDDEFGKINEPKKKNKLPRLDTESAIVSTLLDEWNLSNASTYGGKLFVDIQGYVRDGSAFGKKKAWNDVRNIAPHIFCLKGNEVEIGMLPKEVVDDQKKNRMLIITKGKNGVEIFYKSKHTVSILKPSEIQNPKNTIGAGDTFFANFVYEFMLTNDVKKSADFALKKTSQFLSNIE
jgi:hypothetical protein